MHWGLQTKLGFVEASKEAYLLPFLESLSFIFMTLFHNWQGDSAQIHLQNLGLAAIDSVNDKSTPWKVTK